MSWLPGGNFLTNAAKVMNNESVNFWKAFTNSVIVATGPLTSPALADAIHRLTGESALAFFDAIAHVQDGDGVEAFELPEGGHGRPQRAGRRNAAAAGPHAAGDVGRHAERVLRVVVARRRIRVRPDTQAER